MTKFLVTGAAGFIGFHVSRKLLARGDTVVGVDNLNDYYRVTLKQDRLALLRRIRRSTSGSSTSPTGTKWPSCSGPSRPTSSSIWPRRPACGIRSQNPAAYVDSNLVGFANMLEGCRHSGVKHLVYASSSSVYGANKKLPFAVDDPVDHPLSLYAATKKANELMAHSYSHLYSIPTTGLRFFTVYGPWGRPDMAMWLFAEAILDGRPINVFNHGKMRRDFTYIDDIVEGVVRVADRIPQPGTLAAGPGTGPRHEPRPVSHLQHRQQRAD